MTSKGQITVPSEIRRRLNLRPGSKVDFQEDKHGNVLIKPRSRPLADLAGFFTSDVHLGDDELREAIGRGAVKRSGLR